MDSIQQDIEEFNFDVRRSLLLSSYIKEWGVPINRTRLFKKQELVMELYVFKGGVNDKFIRFASVGISGQSKKEKKINNEILLVLPVSLGGATEDEVVNYIFDLTAYLLRDDVDFRVEKMVPANSFSPDKWRQKAILIDEAKGESESLGNIHVGVQHVKLLWLIPIYGNEYELIANEGIEVFDRCCEEAELSLVDVGRGSFAPLRAV